MNVVAACAAALPADEFFGDASDASFDVLVLDEAEQITESEFLRTPAVRVAAFSSVSRPGTSPHPTLVGLPRLENYGPRPSPVLLYGPAFSSDFGRGCTRTPRDCPTPGRVKERSFRRRLKPVPADQRRWLESESVADSPEIELRILTLPRATPVLAEVVFPSATSIQDAKSFIYTELQELPVQVLALELALVRGSGKSGLRLAGADPGETSRVTLDQGICEVVAFGPDDSRLCCTLAGRTLFPLGWQRERSEEWICRPRYHHCQEQRGPRCLER